MPFRGEGLIATMQMQLNDPPPLEGARAAHLPAQLVPVLRKALAKDPSERYATARGMATALRLVLETIGAPAAALVEIPPLREDWLDLVERTDDESRADRAEVLRVLVLALATGDVPERCGAALTLGRMGPRAKETVPALVEALNDATPHVAEAATSALKRIAGTPPPPAEPPTPEPTESPAVVDLMDMLRHEDAALRRIAVVALGEKRSAAAVPSLVVALGDAPDDLVRASAAEALGRIGGRATMAIPALIEAVTDFDRRLRLRAAAVLTQIVAPPTGPLPSVSPAQMSPA